MEIKLTNGSNFEIDGYPYNLNELQRRVDMNATGATIHRLRGKIAYVGGIINMLRDGDIPTDGNKESFKESLTYILKNA